MGFDGLLDWLKSKMGSSQPAAAQPSAPKQPSWWDNLFGGAALQKAAQTGDPSKPAQQVTPASAGMSMEDIAAAAAAQAAAAKRAQQ